MMDVKTECHNNEPCGQTSSSSNALLSCTVLVNNSSKILETLKKLYIQKLMCDLRVSVGDKIYLAHRIILCSSSDVFHAMLSKPEWSEWKETTITLQELPECEEVFDAFLEYFYTGTILITHAVVLPILVLADKYLLKELSSVCVDYMCRHIPHAASHNQLFLWYQYATNCWHQELATKCFNYIKWNLQAIANTSDFASIDFNMLAGILQEHDIVIYNEFVLFKCVERWVELQRNTQTNQKEFCAQTKKVVSKIRFPMLSTHDLASILVSPVIQQDRDYHFDAFSAAMMFHTGRLEHLKSLAMSSENVDMFTPRLYTSDVYCTELLVENFHSLPSHHTSAFVFSTQQTFVGGSGNINAMNEWVVEFYPKGVYFRRCLLIVWQGTLQVPEEVFHTVRLSLACRELSTPNVRVSVAVLVYGIRDGVEHVVDVKRRVHRFDAVNRIVNIDNVIPYYELNPSPVVATGETSASSPVPTPSSPSHYLIGPKRDQLKLNIIITPVVNIT